MLGKLTARYPLTRLAWISIAAALATIAIKTLAWALTDSVGFLSDAAESVVNLTAAVMALLILHWVARPPDADLVRRKERRGVAIPFRDARRPQIDRLHDMRVGRDEELGHSKNSPSR